MQTRHLALGLISLALLAGCDAPGFTSKSAKSAADQKSAAPVVALPSVGQAAGAAASGRQAPVQTAGLSVSDAIAKACGITPKESGKSVSTSFEFDSATLGEDDREMLGQVARCLTEGALRGHRVNLVGRADARGEDEYNMSLGGSRADTVRRYLQDLGVGRDRLNATSRGELDAVGTNDEGYRLDRRVDVELVD